MILETLLIILTFLGITMALISVIVALGVVLTFARQAIKRLLQATPTITLPKRVPKEEKEKPIMSKEKGEGVTFNDIFMFMIAVPLVLLWVGFAGFVIHSGLNDAAVLEQIEGYTTLIAILGGPALLIIKDALDVWKQEQAEKTAFYKVKAQAVIDYNDSMQKQAQMIEAKAQEQEHKMESKK
jgi:ABC-type antimicrobial peptide transport system permease subunit